MLTTPPHYPKIVWVRPICVPIFILIFLRLSTLNRLIIKEKKHTFLIIWTYIPQILQ